MGFDGAVDELDFFIKERDQCLVFSFWVPFRAMNMEDRKLPTNSLNKKLMKMTKMKQEKVFLTLL